MAEERPLSLSRPRYSGCICISTLENAYRFPSYRVAIHIEGMRYEHTPGTRVVLQLVASRGGVQPDKLDIEDKSGVGRNDLTKAART